MWGGGDGKRGVRGGEMDFFWDYKMTYKVRFQTIDSGKFVVCWEMSAHLLRTHAERPPWGQKKVAVMGRKGLFCFGVERAGTCLLSQAHAYCNLVAYNGSSIKMNKISTKNKLKN